MIRALWLVAAALPLAAQPKLLTNAKVDTHSAAAGLEQEFRQLTAAQPQPAWIAWSVAAVRGHNMGCDYVRGESMSAPGVVHLEPPDHTVILFRVENNAVDRIRALSPDCEIDAGGVAVHWLTDVAPAQSIALLATFVPQRDMDGNGAVTAIGMHADPAADSALERFVAPDQPEWLRQRAAGAIGSARGHHGLEILKNLIANDPSENVRQRAISGLSNSKEPEALDLLIAIARNDKNPRMRAQAVSALSRKSGQPALAAITNAIENDPDTQVRRRAVSALQSLPDGSGIPLLIQVVKTTRDAEVRKQAMNTLGQSHDARALAFFEEVLKK
ncbi:MAG: HEAT repeat domain-containing protein [Acidobacteriia bacterium]|nr:HEAT repeat domain-containing protein [Terriglobia bacterium]